MGAISCVCARVLFSVCVLFFLCVCVPPPSVIHGDSPCVISFQLIRFAEVLLVCTPFLLVRFTETLLALSPLRVCVCECVCVCLSVCECV